MTCIQLSEEGTFWGVITLKIEQVWWLETKEAEIIGRDRIRVCVRAERRETRRRRKVRRGEAEGRVQGQEEGAGRGRKADGAW